MNHRKRNDDQHMFRLFVGMTLIMFLATGVILGVDGISLIWDMINPF